jgi:hypothetical protein
MQKSSNISTLYFGLMAITLMSSAVIATADFAVTTKAASRNEKAKVSKVELDLRQNNRFKSE